MKKLFGAQSICKVNEGEGGRSDALEGTGVPRPRIPALPPVCSHPPPKKGSAWWKLSVRDCRQAGSLCWTPFPIQKAGILIVGLFNLMRYESKLCFVWALFFI